MSHTSLRRVAIRLLHDPHLVDALHDDAAAALAGISLSNEERAWLLAVPRAAWRTDPERPRRVLAALHDEFPAAFAMAPARAERFFRSPHFHAAVQDRGSLALAFGDHMAEDDDERVSSIARLETAAALVRRAPARIPSSERGWLRVSPAARVVHAPRGATEGLAAVRAGRAHAGLRAPETAVLVLRSVASGDVTMEHLSQPLAALLFRATTPTLRAALEAQVVADGADAAEAVTVLDELVSAAILV
jgi:hypothetical protein